MKMSDSTAQQDSTGEDRTGQYRTGPICDLITLLSALQCRAEQRDMPQVTAYLICCRLCAVNQRMPTSRGAGRAGGRHEECECSPTASRISQVDGAGVVDTLDDRIRSPEPVQQPQTSSPSTRRGSRGPPNRTEWNYENEATRHDALQ